jgi:hypothetical protein
MSEAHQQQLQLQLQQQYQQQHQVVPFVEQPVAASLSSMTTTTAGNVGVAPVVTPVLGMMSESHQQQQQVVPVTDQPAAASNSSATTAGNVGEVTAVPTASALGMMSESHEQQQQHQPVVPVVEQPAVASTSSTSTKITGAIVGVPVVPTPNDVITSRKRVKKASGNCYYELLVQRYKEQLTPILSQLITKKDSERFTKQILVEAAERVVGIITRERGGRFIRSPDTTGETPGHYKILSHKEAVNKVYISFRRSFPTNTSATSTVKIAPKAPKKAKVVAATPFKKYRYRIQFAALASCEDPKVDPYMLDIITAVCNHAHSARKRTMDDQLAAVARLLETPPVLGAHRNTNTASASAICTPETDRQGRMRFQLRHRYLAASRVGVSPVILSQRLVEHWGVGQLLLAPPALPPVPQQLPLPMPTLLQQEIMMNTITAPNITVVVAGGGGSEQEKGRDDHEHVLQQEMINAVTDANITAAAAAAGSEQEKGRDDREHVLQQETLNTVTAVNITVVVAVAGGSEQEKGRDDHEHVMLPEHVVPPLVEKKTTVPASGTGTWNQFERIQFLLALEQHGPGDWSKIMPLIPTR